MRKPSPTNVVLATTTVVLAFALGAQMGGSGASPAAYAQAQPEDTTTPPFNAAEQRKQTYIQMVETNRRLAAIEQKLAAGISVKVTEMPDVKIKEPGRK